jgi:hypothetical protein
MYDTKKMNGTQHIAIDGKQTISTLQKEFNKRFPFLKIEFFREPCIKGKGNSKDKMITTNEVISRLQRKKQFGKISFTNQTMVRELEVNFLNPIKEILLNKKRRER